MSQLTFESKHLAGQTFDLYPGDEFMVTGLANYLRTATPQAKNGQPMAFEYSVSLRVGPNCPLTVTASSKHDAVAKERIEREVLRLLNAQAAAKPSKNHPGEFTLYAQKNARIDRKDYSSINFDDPHSIHAMVPEQSRIKRWERQADGSAIAYTGNDPFTNSNDVTVSLIMNLYEYTGQTDKLPHITRGLNEIIIESVVPNGNGPATGGSTVGIAGFGIPVAAAPAAPVAPAAPAQPAQPAGFAAPNPAVEAAPAFPNMPGAAPLPDAQPTNPFGGQTEAPGANGFGQVTTGQLPF